MAPRVQMDEDILQAFLAENPNAIVSQTTSPGTSPTPAPSDATLPENSALPAETPRSTPGSRKTRSERQREKNDAATVEQFNIADPATLAATRDDARRALEAQSLRQLRDRAIATVRGATAGTHDRIAALPTPGGIVLLLGTLMFLVWVLVPANAQGATRASLLWHTLTGRTSLKGRRRAADVFSDAAPAGAQAVQQVDPNDVDDDSDFDTELWSTAFDHDDDLYMDTDE